MDAKEFHAAMREHCETAKAECQNCCMRLFCYTPPCERTDGMIDVVTSFLTLEHSRKGADNHSGHLVNLLLSTVLCSHRTYQKERNVGNTKSNFFQVCTEVVNENTIRGVLIAMAIRIIFSVLGTLLALKIVGVL